LLSPSFEKHYIPGLEVGHECLELLGVGDSERIVERCPEPADRPVPGKLHHACGPGLLHELGLELLGA